MILMEYHFWPEFKMPVFTSFVIFPTRAIPSIENPTGWAGTYIPGMMQSDGALKQKKRVEKRTAFLKQNFRFVCPSVRLSGEIAHPAPGFGWLTGLFFVKNVFFFFFPGRKWRHDPVHDVIGRPEIFPTGQNFPHVEQMAYSYSASSRRLPRSTIELAHTDEGRCLPWKFKSTVIPVGSGSFLKKKIWRIGKLRAPDTVLHGHHAFQGR